MRIDPILRQAQDEPVAPTQDAHGRRAQDIRQDRGERKAGEARSLADGRDAKLRQACQDFEAVFLNQLLKSMRKTVMKSDLFGGSREEELFQEMMDLEIAKSIARTNSTGMADLLYRQLHADIERRSSASEERGDSR